MNKLCPLKFNGGPDESVVRLSGGRDDPRAKAHSTECDGLQCMLFVPTVVEAGKVKEGACAHSLTALVAVQAQVVLKQLAHAHAQMAELLVRLNTPPANEQH